MKIIATVFVLMLLSGYSFAQTGSTWGVELLFSGAPTGACTGSSKATDTTTGNLYGCLAGSWVLIGPGSATLSSPITSPNPLQFNVNTVFKGPNPYVDIAAYGGRAVSASGTPGNPGCTATINSGLTAATLSSACGLITGDGIDIWGAGATNVLSTPAAPTVTPRIAQGSTGTGYVVNGPAGATSYAYEIVAFDAGEGVTAASAAGTTATGAATLGANTVNITSQSRANNVTTVTTATAHGLPIGCGGITITGCPVVFISNANSLTDVAEFFGWFVVTSVADNTHFTYNSGIDTRFGVLSAISTGGTATWWNSNNLQLPTTNPAGVRQYAIYGRNCPGTCNLIGISLPVNSVNQGDVAYMTWDDFGATMMGSATFPGWLPTTAPGAATNDTLVTTIASGGGTTSITTANAASNSVAGATILIDTTPALLAAEVAAFASGGAVYISSPSVTTNNYFINSYADISSVNGYAVISQSARMILNDTIVWQNGQWHGDLQLSGGSATMSGGQFSFESHAPITVGAAYPGIYMKNGGGTFRGLTFQGPANMYDLIFNTGTAPVIFEDTVFNGGSGADLMGVQYYGWASTGGGFGGIFRNITFGAGTPTSSTATPLFIGKNSGLWNFRAYGTLSNRGLTFIAGNNGGCNVTWDLAGDIQGGSMPVLAFMSRGVGGGINWQSGNLDTVGQPAVANWSVNGAAFVSGIGSGSSGGIATLTGNPFATVTMSTLTSSLSLIGQNFNLSIGQSVGGILDGGANSGFAQVLRGDSILGANYSFFTDPGVPAAPTCAVITGGPPFAEAGTFQFLYSGIYPNGGRGVASPLSNSCTSNGTTQQITVTLPSLLPGVGTYVWQDQGNNFSKVNGSCPNTTTTALSWTYEGGNCGFGSIPASTGGGLAGIQNGKVWAQSEVIGQTTITSNATVPRTLVLPDTNLTVQGTGAKLQAATGSFTNTDLLSYDVNGNAVDSGISSSTIAGKFTCVNVTPVTVNANVSTDQTLMACTIPAGTLNLVGRTVLIQLAGVYSTPAASTTAVNLKAKLCTVSGCGSGTVITLASITSAALGGIQATNDPFNMTLNASTQTAGASSAYEVHGNLTIDVSVLTSAAEAVYADGNTATIGTIDSTAQLFLQITGAFSAASGSNSMTQRQLIVDSVD
jgi:hypothetical protein